MVVGDMLELGQHSESLHHKLGILCAKSKISRIYATGKFAESVAAGAREEDMDSGNIILGTKEAIYESIIGWLDPGDWVLVKGSRSMAMEKIAEKLLKWANS
jgi:UDP-N-acetylmuramyl pentapeptide synthase